MEPQPAVHRDPIDGLLDRRAELAQALSTATWPATVEDLAAVAVRANADDAAQLLARLPSDRRFAVFGELWDALAPSPERVAATPPRPRRSRARTSAPQAPRLVTIHQGFAFEPLLRPFAFAFGILPRTSWVDVDGERLEIRFGPWVLRTPLANVAGCEVTGPYRVVKVAGPPHLSAADRGITFATNRRRGVCIRFHEPVTAALPIGLLRHPAATVTVEDPDALVEALAAFGAPSRGSSREPAGSAERLGRETRRRR